MLARVANVLIGVWLLVLPLVVSHTDVAARNALVVGGLLVVVGLVALFVLPAARYISAALGLYLIAAPFIWSYALITPMLASLFLGFATLGIALFPSHPVRPRELAVWRRHEVHP